MSAAKQAEMAAIKKFESLSDADKAEFVRERKAVGEAYLWLRSRGFRTDENGVDLAARFIIFLQSFDYEQA